MSLFICRTVRKRHNIYLFLVCNNSFFFCDPCCRRCHHCTERIAIPWLYDVAAYRGTAVNISHIVSGQTTMQTVFTDVFGHVIFTSISFRTRSITLRTRTCLQTVLLRCVHEAAVAVPHMLCENRFTIREQSSGCSYRNVKPTHRQYTDMHKPMEPGSGVVVVRGAGIVLAFDSDRWDFFIFSVTVAEARGERERTGQRSGVVYVSIVMK